MLLKHYPFLRWDCRMPARHTIYLLSVCALYYRKPNGLCGWRTEVGIHADGLKSFAVCRFATFRPPDEGVCGCPTLIRFHPHRKRETSTQPPHPRPEDE